MRDAYDLVIVGSGIMGLSCGYEIAKKVGSSFSILIIDSGKHYLSQKPCYFQRPICQQSIQSIDSLNLNFFHPSASYNAAGILASNGAQTFRSPLRKNLVDSIRYYPDWLKEISQLIDQQIQLLPIKDYHFYDETDSLERKRYQSLLDRLQFEQATDGEVVSWDDFENFSGFTKNNFSFSSAKIVQFNHNHLLSPPQLLTSLVIANQKLGTDFLWESQVVDFESSLSQSSSNCHHFRVKVKPISNVLLEFVLHTKFFLLTMGWETKLFSQLPGINNVEALSGSKNVKSDSGIIKISPSQSFFKKTPVVIRFGGKNYSFHTDKFDCYCGLENMEKQNEFHSFFLKSFSSAFEEKFGLRPVSPTKKPIVHWEEKQNWGIVTGHHKMGIGLAPLTAKKVADQFTERILLL